MAKSQKGRKAGMLSAFILSFVINLLALQVVHGQSVTDLGTLNQMIRDGDIKGAANLARSLDDKAPEAIDLSIPLAQIARQFQIKGKSDQSTDFYTRSLKSLQRPAAKNLPKTSAIVVRLAAASAFIADSQFEQATGAIVAVFEDSKAMTDAQRSLSVDLCLSIGSEALKANRTDLAFQVYGFAAKYGAESQKSTGMLGAAWAAAMAENQPEQAARMMAKFIESYPKHPEASRASRVCATCLKQAGRIDDSNAILADLLTRWPDSEAAHHIVREQISLPIEELSDPVRRWILDPKRAEKLTKLDSRFCAVGLQIAATESDHNAWDRFANLLGEFDKSGQATSDLLQQFSSGEEKNLAQAERLAAAFLSPAEGSAVNSRAREAACRWAGRNQLWNMLSLAAKSTTPETEDPSRTASIERLFAEALMQSGERDRAREWWVHLVDVRRADDFATLLRCAETEASIGDASEAQNRIDDAKKACGEDVYRQNLVAMLAAELAIRRLHFDQARSELESVVRSSETNTELRGRAQWMIGETYFLQEKHTEAISAYRSVAGLDPDGPWIAAALVQAGKSFEQLGRTRDAAVCYSTLLSQHADSHYATLARNRLAALSTDSPTNYNTKTLRR